jgi:hemolysin III
MVFAATRHRLSCILVGPNVASKAQVHIPFHQGSETFSFWTHGVSMVTALAMLVWMIVRAGSNTAVVAYAIYGVSMVLLFFASTLHHAVQSTDGDHRSGFIRRLDHISIFVFIAGTYTPICLLALPPAWGISILSVVGGLAVAGVAMKLFAPFAPAWLTVTLYISLGWVAVVGIKPLLDVFTIGALAWMFGGGVVYTVGAVGYAKHWPNLWPKWLGAHGVWHVMVMIGAALHLAFIIRFLPVA